MPEDNRRYISRVQRTEGPYTVDEIYGLIVDRKVNYETLFWSEKKQAWKSITGLILDIDPDKTDEYFKAGIKQIKIVSTGDRDCPTCLKLIDKVFPINRQPVLPPVECRCNPWCRLVIAPVQEATP